MPDVTQPTKTVELVDPSWTLKGEDEGLYFQHDQDISDPFLDRIKDVRTASPNRRENEFMEIAEIPVAVVEKWKREGFDIYRESAKSILRRLSAENLGYFISTSKHI